MADDRTYIVDLEPGIFGPFTSRQAAHDWATDYLRGNGSFTVRVLKRPSAPQSEVARG